ncbi:MAG: hydantoinase/oxoprolinase family protein [Candidatus Eisenbacteria bacterium]|uniref:Hydantoinase/oxoprolinase family protein n=1 Tax=Eiseniibacteriota bacterium TaxID=2212470 RepID=A0A933W1Z8_UNCEI|nr:hydantoinase/oxoprolinase family protein [Candidatus Eisenbacteria bacterium]
MKRARGAAAARAIGVDTGGTFTDVVVWRDGRQHAFKVPSTPDAPARAVLEGLRRAGADARTQVRHGSTIATNALLERKGARAVFVTTKGFEDALEIARQDRPDLYSLAPARREPLVPATRRFGVDERLDERGRTVRALTAAAVTAVVRRVRAAEPEAIALGLLHSYANAAHERRLARALAALGVPVTVSSALCPEIREYERFATSAANAYLAPRVAAYLGALAEARLGRIEVVLSHGGTAPIARAAKESVRQLLSGPAAGLRAALDAARASGHEAALTLDVGGTSTDVALLGAGETGRDGLPRRRAREVGGVPVLLPTLDVHTVGAGGGSIARVDAGGLLRVGPESAGADPGPACYGRGGPATVTDALVVLGRIPFDTLAGGALTLDRAAARRALGAIAKALRLRDAAAAAAGVLAIADAHMEAALRRVSVEQGADPRDCAIVAYGGAGGLHACSLAESLGARAVVWPRHAGVLCALGALTGGSRRERGRSVLLPAAGTAALEREFRRLEREVLAEFAPAERRRVTLSRHVEARCRGQAHEIELAAPVLAFVARDFHAAHRRRFGVADEARAVIVVSVQVRGALPAERMAERPSRSRTPAPASAGVTARVRVGARTVAARVVARAALAPGAVLSGPAVVHDDGATLWVAPRWNAVAQPDGSLALTRARGSRGARRTR